MRNLKKLTLTLVALFAMTTGAWADGTLLTTITASADFQSGSKTFDNIATVTLTGNFFGSSDWAGNGTITVEPANASVNITSVKFFSNGGAEVEDTQAPYQAVQAYNSNMSYYQFEVDGTKGNYPVNKIEVYGTAAPAGTALTPDDTRKVWTLDAMPAGNVELQVAYFPGMLTLAKAEGGSIELVSSGAAGEPVQWNKETWAGWAESATTHTVGDITVSTTGSAKAYQAEGSGEPLALQAGANDAITFTSNGKPFASIAISTDDELNLEGWTYNSSTWSYEWSGEPTTSVTLSGCDIKADEINFTFGGGLPAGFDTDGTNYYVEPKTQFQVKAVPATGYHLVSLSDGTNTYDVDADGIATVTMPEGDKDLTLTATFSNEFELTFDDVNFKTNQNITVKVGDADKTLDQDGKLSVKAGQTVTLTAKQGYKFRSVEAKKKAAALLSLQVCGRTLYYAEGETWGDAIKNHPTENAGWNLDGDGYVNHDSFGYLLVSNDFVPGNTPIDPNASYDCTGL